jgi:hypothetical protein
VDPDYATLLRSRLLRVLVTLTTFIVVWLVARPAMAMMDGAPVCDPRGAAGFAPPPQFQDPEQSLDIVTNDDDCTQSPLESRHVVPSHRAPATDFSSTSQDPAAAGASVVIERAVGGLLPAPDASEVLPRSGFRDAVERPPRG